MLPNKQLNAIALELADILQYNLIGTTVAFKILVGIWPYAKIKLKLFIV